jgi:hypothetical protein
MIDRALTAAVARLAAIPGLAVSERQLYHEVCRTLRPIPGPRVPGAWGLLAAGLLGGLATTAIAAGTSAVALTLARNLPYTRSPPIDEASFAAALARHTARRGRPAILAQRTGLYPALTNREPDLWDYGMARALVLDDDDLAAALVATGLHLELGCAVFGLADAGPLPAPVLAMLARTPGARVFHLHAASHAALAGLPQLRARLGLPLSVGLAPIGLRPAHARAMHLFTRTGSPPARDAVAALIGLAPRERAWLLAGHTCDVAAIPPLRLLRALRRLLLGIRQPSPPTRAQRRAGGFLTWPPP